MPVYRVSSIHFLDKFNHYMFKNPFSKRLTRLESIHPVADLKPPKSIKKNFWGRFIRVEPKHSSVVLMENPPSTTILFDQNKPLRSSIHSTGCVPVDIDFKTSDLVNVQVYHFTNGIFVHIFGTIDYRLYCQITPEIMNWSLQVSLSCVFIASKQMSPFGRLRRAVLFFLIFSPLKPLPLRGILLPCVWSYYNYQYNHIVL